MGVSQIKLYVVLGWMLWYVEQNVQNLQFYFLFMLVYIQDVNFWFDVELLLLFNFVIDCLVLGVGDYELGVVVELLWCGVDVNDLCFWLLLLYMVDVEGQVYQSKICVFCIDFFDLLFVYGVDFVLEDLCGNMVCSMVEVYGLWVVINKLNMLFVVSGS